MYMYIFAGLVPPPQAPGNKSHLIVINQEELKASDSFCVMNIGTFTADMAISDVHVHCLDVHIIPIFMTGQPQVFELVCILIILVALEQELFVCTAEY